METEHRDDWAVIVDPAWKPVYEGEVPPSVAVVGGWPLDEAGAPGPFEPNPAYRPADESSPTDPADAVMRLIVEGKASIEALVVAVRDAVLQVAVSEDGYPLVGPAPDGAPCVAVVTAAAHRERVESEHWASVTAQSLLAGLPEGTDLLLNPGSPASTRLFASALRTSFQEDPGPAE